jgi:hypothetical protein
MLRPANTDEIREVRRIATEKLADLHERIPRDEFDRLLAFAMQEVAQDLGFAIPEHYLGHSLDDL